MNTLNKTTPNQLEKATEQLKKYKTYTVPTEIREDEAHLTHVITIKSTPNAKTMEFDTTAKIIKLNDESLEAMKKQLPRFGVYAILHDGKKWRTDQKKENTQAQAPNANKDNKAEVEAKEAELQANNAKQAENMRRLGVLFNYGFVFNGQSFVKEGETLAGDKVNDMTAEDFDKVVEGLETEKKEAEAQAKKEAELAEYNALLEEAKGLEMDVTKYKGVEDLKDLKADVAKAKKPKTGKA